MEWLGLVLGGGFVATIGAVFKGLQMLRDSTAARTAKGVKDLERWRVEADERTRTARQDADWYATLADYWRARAGTAEFEARSAGVTLQPPPVMPTRPARTPEEVAPQ